MKIFYIATLLIISLSLAHAESDLDIWNKALNPQSSQEACTALKGSCSETKVKTLSSGKTIDAQSSSLEKKGSAIKMPSKAKKNPVVLNVEEIDIETAAEPLEKQVRPFLKITLSVIVGAMFGFMFIYFYRRWRKNNG